MQPTNPSTAYLGGRTLTIEVGPRVLTISAARADRFWQFVDLRPNGCHIWAGGVSRGYGSFSIQGRNVRAHRVAWVLAGRDLPHSSTGLVLDHLCRNTACVNVEHLQVVTQATNILLGTAPAAIHARKVECIRGHSLTDEANLIRHKDGSRECATCDARREDCPDCGKSIKARGMRSHERRMHTVEVAS